MTSCALPKLRSTFEINKMQKRLCNMCPAGAVMGQDEVFGRHSPQLGSGFGVFLRYS